MLGGKSSVPGPPEVGKSSHTGQGRVRGENEKRERLM